MPLGVTIGVDRSAGPELTGVERGRRLERDRDVTVRLPPLISDEILEVSAESLDRQFAIGGQLFVVRVVDGDHVVVGGQVLAAVEVLDAVVASCWSAASTSCGTTPPPKTRAKTSPTAP